MTVKQFEKARDWVFRKMHGSNLVYNTCWEDPRCDRELMALDADSEVVMITSAGCNALDYLLDDPAKVNCVDVNPRQNALLQLKQAAFAKSSFEDLFKLFGDGVHPQADDLFRDQLQKHLPEYARQYWEKNLHFFNGKGLRRSFYHYSTSGTFAWLSKQYLRTRRKLYHQARRMFEAETLEEQAAIYYAIEPKVLNKLIQWVLNRHLTMSLVGVPRSQQKMVTEKYDNGTLGYIQECFRKVFTELPLRDNYFYQVYFRGKYEHDICPNYLRPEHFDFLCERIDRISTTTTTISNFLREHPGPYSHYVLLDHQDWLAANDVPALEEEWRLILKNSRPGTKILLRSAAEKVDFFPDFVREAVDFNNPKAAETHRRDRVGTYASVYLGTVR